MSLDRSLVHAEIVLRDVRSGVLACRFSSGDFRSVCQRRPDRFDQRGYELTVRVPWEKTFPDELGVEFGRLTNRRGNVQNRPQVLGPSREWADLSLSRPGCPRLALR